MWNSNTKTKVKRKKEKVKPFRAFTHSRRTLSFCLLSFAFLLSSCRRDMQDQPKTIAYRENSFYKDGTGSRPLVEGTVPRGYLREDRTFFLGKKATAQPTPNPPQAPPTGGSGNSQAGPQPARRAPIPLQLTTDMPGPAPKRANIH